MLIIYYVRYLIQVRCERSVNDPTLTAGLRPGPQVLLIRAINHISHVQSRQIRQDRTMVTESDTKYGRY